MENFKIETHVRYGWTDMGELVSAVNGLSVQGDDHQELSVSVGSTEINLELLGEVYETMGSAAHNGRRKGIPFAPTISLKELEKSMGSESDEWEDDLDQFVEWGFLSLEGLSFKAGTYAVDLGDYISAAGELKEDISLVDSQTVPLYLKGIGMRLAGLGVPAIVMCQWDEEREVFMAITFDNNQGPSIHEDLIITL